MNDDDAPQEPTSEPFVPVCAIGASAGGVTALQGLFRQLPNNLGLAYVVVLHLSPDQPSALSDILSGCTKMPVREIQDAPTLEPDCVYVIPPDRELIIRGDSVTARPFTEPRGRRAPIDMFFRSVAAARGDGVAIVLSGAGADGAVGVRAIKEAGGVIMVQEPAEAAFASMPQNAIATGDADFVAPLARLAERLAEVARSKEAVRSLDMDGSANDLRRIIAFLRARTGHDFSSYKRATVMRRVIRRMQVCRTDTLTRYADYLLSTPEEAKELFADLLISVTMFFRDAHAFEALERQAIKLLFDDLDPEKEEGIRAWVVGCASGEEAYSLAMLLHEEAARRQVHVQFQIFATDLDDGALATAREGRYPRSIEADVSEERLARFFIDEGTHYRVRKELRESVLFATHSVLKEPPFMRLDLITCRNLLIYLERTLQQQICSIFHYGLKPGRFLFLGSAETADAAAELFAPLDREARIYGARPHAAHALPVLPQFAMPERFVGPEQSRPMQAERADVPVALHVAALERTAPASVLVDSAQNIVHFSPSAGRYVLHSAGPMSNLLPAIVRPELRLDLRLALTRVLDTREPILTHPTVVALDGDRRRISMHVTPVPNGERMGAQALVFFLDGGSVPDDEETETLPDAQPDEVRRLHAELKTAQEAVVASRRGHETAMQDLRASNEELQSINEEYRSTAEELETSKEELQSINEELHTVNAELRSKLKSISVAHSDLQNLTDATEIGTLFLDGDLHIKMFTPPIAGFFNVTRADVGRTITDFSHRLDYDGIDDDARQVLRQLAPIEREVHSRDARSYVMRMRPYRTIEDRIDGVVLTFFDITDRLRAEAALRESEAKYRKLFETMEEGYGLCEVIRDSAGQVIDWRYLELNPALERHSGMDVQAVVGRLFSELFPDTDRSYWLSIYQTVMDTQSSQNFEDYWAPIDRWIAGEASPAGGERFYVIYRDVTERKRAELALRESEERQAFLLKLSDALRPLTDPSDIQTGAMRVLGQHLGAFRAQYFEAEPDDEHVRPGGGYAERQEALVTDRVLMDDFGSFVKADFRMGSTVVVSNTATDPRVREKDARSYAAYGMGAYVAVPLVKAGRFIVCVGVHNASPRDWTSLEVGLVEETAERTWAAVERARAEAGMRESEAQRRIALEGGRMGTWRWDLANRLIRGDARFFAFWGFPPSDEPHPLEIFSERMSPEGAAEMEAIVTKAIAADEEFDGQLAVVAGPTAGRWIRWRGRADPRAPSVLYGVTFDVTAQRQTEHALRESEERQAFLLTLTDALRPLVDARDIKAAAAARVSEWLDIASAGYAEVEASGLTSVITDEFNDGRIPSLMARYTLKDFSSVTEPMQRGETIHFADLDDDGVSPDTRAAFTAINVRAAVAAPLIKNRVMVAYLFVAHPVPRVWTASDLEVLGEVTDRTWAAVERARAETALRESEERFAQFAASSSDGLWIRDAATLAMEYVSPAIEAIYGVPPNALLGNPKHWAALIVPEDREIAMEHLEQARRGEAVVHEFRIQRPSDGAFRWIRNTDFPLHNGNARVRRIGGIAQDVSEAKLAAEHQAVLLAELQHRVRNIMAQLRAITAQTAETAADVPDYAALMAGRLQTFARVQALLTRGANVGVGVDTIVRDELRAQARHEGQYTLSGPDLVLSPKAAEVLTLAVHELATNALKYGALSGPDGRVTVHWETFEWRETPWLRFDWTEEGAPERPPQDPAVPRRRGFGSELIEGRIPYELAAAAT